MGEETIVGAELPAPLINDVTRKLNYSNQLCANGTINFHRRTSGLFILDECKRYWAQQQRDVSEHLLPHLATTVPAFESLINPSAPCFSEPGDMPLKVQAYCRETGQEIPRKPGHVYRCVLESLALHYRKMVAELEVLTGRRFQRLYLLGADENPLLNNFIADALQLPVTLATPNVAATGNVLLQAKALGHINSLPEGREIVRRSMRAQTIVPHPTSWDTAAERLLNLIGHSGEAVPA
jgi:rhamnulokinase